MPKILPRLASFALALGFFSFSAPDASAQLFERLREHNRAFYGPLYQESSYADSIGLRGLHRCENGGYYGQPQMYSRQYGTYHGYRNDPPFSPPRINNGPGYSGDFNR